VESGPDSRAVVKDLVPGLNILDAPARDLVQVVTVQAFGYKFMRWFGKSRQSRAARGDLPLGMGSAGVSEKEAGEEGVGISAVS
jgi:hypothetical protein